MDKKLKMKWVKALESGRYLQGRGQLSLRRPHEETKYCCIGVLREIIEPRARYSTEETSLLEGEHHRIANLSNAKSNRLAGMNDSGKTFRQIAAWIRKHL